MNLFELFVKIGVKDEASKSIGDISEKLGKGLQTASKIGTSAIVSFGTMAIKTFADYEQLIGGSELMFGEAFETVKKNSQEAYKTVQMSQNEYLQQVNGFATGLKTALGGNELAAAQLSHRIVQAEADIVAATGNTQENVQNAFNGIMKSNFTMLDNLQIGITPTKEGFQEVIDKVNEWNAANGRATKYQMGNLADMQSALVDYIDMVGMSGYAQKEASGTILGSFSSMKAAASDFMTALVSSNGDVEGSFETLKETAFTFFDNIKPKILEFLKSISPIAATVAGITGAFVSFKAAASISSLLRVLIKSWQSFKLANEGATISQWALNAAMNANPIVLIVTLIGGLVAALVTLWHTNDDFKQSVIDAWEGIKEVFSKVGDFSKETFEKIGQFFENTLNETTQFFSNVWSDLGSFFTDLWSDITGFFDEAGENASTFFSDIWGNITDFFTGIWTDITGFFSKMWAGIQEFLDRPGYYIGYAIGFIWKQITTFFTETIPEAWESFKEWFFNGLNAIGDAITNFFTVTIPKKWENFKTWFFNGLTAIGESIKNFFTQTIPNAWNSFTAWLSEGFAKLSESVKTFFTETIPNAWAALKDKAREIMENVTNTISEFFTVTIPKKWEEFKTNATNRINSIKDWFKNLPKTLSTIGKNIVEGLWEGIKKRWNKLKDDAKGLLDDFIQGFKDGLGIASPSKLFKLFGRYIDEGLSIGLLDNADVPIRAIESVSDELVSAFDPSLSADYITSYDGYGSSSYGGSSSAYSNEEASSSVNITFGEKAFYIANFNGNSESEVDNFVDAVIDKLTSKIQSREAVFA